MSENMDLDDRPVRSASESILDESQMGMEDIASASDDSRAAAGEDFDSDDDDVIDPSPLEKRLREGIPFNLANWTSKELHILYTGIKEYGTSDAALESIRENGLQRTSTEVHAMMDEIRQLNREQREERMKDELYRWKSLRYDEQIDTLYSKGHTNPTMAANKICDQYRGTGFRELTTVIKDKIKSIPTPPVHDVIGSESKFARYPNAMFSLDWKKINDYVADNMIEITRGTRAKGKSNAELNPLEASIILKILDDIEFESRESLTNTERAIYRGIMSNIDADDMTDFEPDTPCDDRSVAQVIYDPLRTRLWGLPEGGGGATLTAEKTDEIRLALNMTPIPEPSEVQIDASAILQNMIREDIKLEDPEPVPGCSYTTL